MSSSFQGNGGYTDNYLHELRMATARKTNKPYRQDFNCNGHVWVMGPSNGGGMSYYSTFGQSWPGKQHAEEAAALCNQAYQQGYEQAQRELRLVLGIK